MADGKKKVIQYGTNKKETLFEGTETECRKWVMSQASDHIKRSDGRLLVGVIEDPDGIAYDVGQSIIYQIVDGNK